MKTKVLFLLIILLIGLTSLAFSNDSIVDGNSKYFPDIIEIIMPKEVIKKSNLDYVREWILALASVATLITLSIGSWKSLAEYRLKIKAEKRLSESSQIQADINLLKYFSEIMDIAHARRRSEISEKTIEKLFESQLVKIDDNTDFKKLNNNIADVAIFTFPVGVAAQDAAIASISELAIRHQVLRKPALQGLESIKSFKKDLAEKYISEIEQANNNS